MRRLEIIASIMRVDHWLRSPRTILTLMFCGAASIIAAYRLNGSLQQFSFEMGLTEALAWELSTGFGSMMMITVMFLVAMEETPDRIPVQNYALLRSNRLRWLFAQIWLIVLKVLLVLILMMVIVTICFALSPVIQFKDGWSDLARQTAGIDYGIHVIPSWALENFTPMQVCCLSFLVLFVFWFANSFLILLTGLLGKASLGFAICAVILFSARLFVFENFSGLETPMVAATLHGMLERYSDMVRGRLVFFAVIYASIILILQIACVLVIKKVDIPSFAMNR